MIDKIRSMWKRATCRHEVDKLRFVRKIYGDEINLVDGKRYEYQCAVCGKMVYKERPITCEGCKYIASDKFGSILCSREYEDFCLLVNRKYWIEGGEGYLTAMQGATSGLIVYYGRIFK